MGLLPALPHQNYSWLKNFVLRVRFRTLPGDVAVHGTSGPTP